MVAAAPRARAILVSGASGGVGRGIAIACGAAGYEVWIAARREREASAVADEVTAAGGSGRFVACDVGDAASVAQAIATLTAESGGLFGVVHNATSGLSPLSKPAQEIGVTELEDHVRVALRGLYLLARSAHPWLRRSGGSFVVTTSEAGFEGKRLLSAYAMVKAAQRGMIRVLAREWGPDGIRVNAIAPLASTPALAQAFVSDPSMKDRVLGRNPLGRLGDATDDIGSVVRFLLGDDARYVTGQTVMVDGGSCPVV